ncbi:MAG TPA: zinc-binding dehydrogenase [Acidimicrobiales bacterium]|nr:zinc-binding dehydrogenase [Acidimicrobiales bacterium]
MHAVVNRTGELAWEERPDPEPGDTELLVAVRAAGINGADLAQRRGAYPAPPGSPADVPGLELAGEVVATGRQVTRFRAGDRVMAVVGGGGQATMATVDESHALTVPAGLSWPEAGGFPEVFSTAFDALWSQCGLTVGERVLVTGAAGGVGTAGVQLAVAAGAHVVASVRNEAQRDAVGGLGAHEVIEPAEVAGFGPYDVVLELVGAPSLPDALGALRTGGRAVVIGVGGGASMELNLLQLMGKRARLSGSTLRARSRAEKAAVATGVAAHVLPLLESGRVRVPVHATVPMAEAGAGYDLFAAGGKTGKIVLVA